MKGPTRLAVVHTGKLLQGFCAWLTVQVSSPPVVWQGTFGTEGRAKLVKAGVVPAARKLMMRESTPDEGRVAVGSLLAAISGRPASATIFGWFDCN